MKKRILSFLLMVVMILSSLPVSAYAAEVPSTEIDIEDLMAAAYIVETVTIEGAAIVNYEETGENTLNVELSGDTDPSANLKVTFNGSSSVNNIFLDQDVFDVTLQNGEGTLSAEMCPMQGNHPLDNYMVTYTIHFTTQKGNFYEVKGLTGTGYVIEGDKRVAEGSNYEFTLELADGYKADPDNGVLVTVNGNQMEPVDGKYIVENVNENLVIEVLGVVAREICGVNFVTGDGYTFSGKEQVYKGDGYTFTVTVQDGYDATGMKVLLGGNEIAATEVADHTYTYVVESVVEDLTVEVTGVTAKELISISLPTVKGLKISGNAEVYAGDDYSFTVSAKSGYTATNIVVTVDGEIISGKNGTYTIKNITKSPDIIITATVTNEPTAWKINYTKRSSYGTWDSVVITDSSGNAIEGMNVEWAANTSSSSLKAGTLTITLPTNFPTGGKIKVKFQTTSKKNNGYPIIATKNNATSGISSRTITTNSTDGKTKTDDLFFIYASGSRKYDTITIKVTIPKNTAPSLTVGETSVAEEILQGENYSLNLASLFTDADENDLTYEYKVGESETWQECDEDFVYGSELSCGDYVLTFRTSDGKDYSSEDGSYTVYLKVKGSDGPVIPTYDVTVTAPSGVTFYASNEEGTKGQEIESTETGGVYTLAVPEDVTYILWRDGDAGMSAAIPESKELTLIKTAFKVLGEENQEIEATVSLKYGEQVVVGSDNTFLLLQTDGGYTYVLTPGSDVSGYMETVKENWIPVDGEVEVQLDPEHFKVIAPAGSVVSAGTLNGSFKYTWETPIGEPVTEGDTVIYKFKPMNDNPFIRVQRPDDVDAVTYWDYKSSKKVGDVITVTEDKLYMNDSATTNFNANTVYRNFEQYTFDLADIFMNINAQGYLNLNVGGTKELNMFRSWQAVESISNAKIALPDFSYEIITVDGNDVISINLDKNNSAVATLTAKNPGTAIVLVTYDAMNSEMGLTCHMGTADESGANGTGGPFQFSAIWPDRTGVFVVSVGKDGSGIETNMTLNDREFDAEHTPLFYIGDEGAQYSFKPEDGCVVTVNRSTVGTETLSFGGFTSKGVSVAMDGTVTVSGLTSGRHIIKVEKNGVATYQVVTATKVNVTLTDAEGNLLTETNKVKPGETVKIIITGLTNPAEKFATAYNFVPNTVYKCEDGTSVSGEKSGEHGGYDFNSSTHTFEIVIPNSWRKNTFQLDNGRITLGGNSGVDKLGDHRNYSYSSGRPMATGLPLTENLGQLPVIVIPVDDPIPATSVTLEKTEVTLMVGELLNLKATVEPADTTDALQWTSSDESVATVKDGAVTTVSEGEAIITATAGDKTATCKVTVKASTGGIIIEPDNSTSGNMGSDHRMISKIAMVGVNGSVIESSDSGNTGKTYTVELSADTDKNKAITFRMSAYIWDRLTAANKKNTYFWVNTPNSTQKSVYNIYEMTEGAVAVVPEWTSENTAVVHVGLGTADQIVDDTKKTPVYTINFVIAEKTVDVTGVSLSQTLADVNIGETVQLNATVMPEDATNKGIVWTSSDPAIATVDDNGLVTGKKAGNATIKVTTADGNFTAECNVTVSYVPVSGITLNKKTEELKPGQWVSLLATITPANATEQTITWDSSDKNVATVDENGKITALAEGNTIITAKAGEKIAQCEITVAKKADTDGKATVYLSITKDAEFVKTDKGVVTALQKFDVPWFDLNSYDLGEYQIPQNNPDYGKPTMLHLFIYATEILQCGVKAEDAGKGYLYANQLMGTDLFKVSGTPGSISMDKFWGMNSNFLYYHNYVYPADATGYGKTADRVVLEDGDIVTRANFTSTSFHSDSNSAFNFIEVNGETITVSALQNKDIQLKVYRTGKDLLQDGVTSITLIDDPMDIYYVKADTLTSGNVADWTLLGTTDSTGKLVIDTSLLTPGEYILAVNGRKGVENPKDFVASPGGILLTVLEDNVGPEVHNVIDLIDVIGDVSLISETAISAARAAYDALTDEQRENVVNYSMLLAAETKLAELKQEKADQEAAEAVVEKINAIGTVTLDSGDAIEAARKAYDALTESQKELVDSDDLKKLTDAEKAYAQLTASENDKNAAKAVEEKIDSIGNVTLDKEQTITAARIAYEALTDAQKALVNNIDVLESAEKSLETLKLAGTDIANIYEITGNYLSALTAPVVGTQNGEWRVLGLARAERQVPDSYYWTVAQYVAENMDSNGRLKDSFATESARLIIALTAIGRDVTNVEGYNLLSGLNDMTYIGKQGINGTIWSLIAFDSYDYELPDGNVTRDKLVQTIVNAQLSDGGWALGGQKGDSDITGMALQALAPYYGKNTAVTSAVDKALNWLSGIQNANGTFAGSDGITCESLAQVITGLTSLGINPETDTRFVKNGVSAMDAMSMFFVEGGGFRHGLTGERNMMSTEQGYYALVSYFRLIGGKTSLYDMSDVTIYKPVYKITEGGNVTWQTDDGELRIVSDGAFAKFTGVKVDDTLVDSKNYTAKEGSTIVTFKAEYVKSLALGTHTVKILFTDGEAATSITIALSDAEAVKVVEDLIDSIGTVTKDSKEAIKAARDAYNALTDEQKAKVGNYSVLTEAEEKYDEIASTITVKFTLLGCYAHGEDEVHTLVDGNLGTWIATRSYKVEPGATVKDVFEKALTQAGMSWRNPTGNYVESINGLGEFSNGTYSGWMYTINGIRSNLGVAQQAVKDGDVIIFHYTDDYTKEDGKSDKDDKKAAEAVEKLIDQIISGSDNFETAVAEAKKAYDALTDEQKKLVGNFDKLEKALKELAKLKAKEDYEDIYKTTGDYLESLGTPSVGSIGGEWMVIGLARSGRDVPKGYYDAAVAYVKENIDENERLNANKSTENARMILALTAIGKDVTDVDGHNLLAGLNEMAYVQKQGINGPIWALIAFDSGNYPMPEGDVTRDALIQVILDAQLSDGGWALSGEKADADMTGMALQALAPYVKSNKDVEKAVNFALNALSDMQAADGSYAGFDGTTAESIAQVITALSALGIDAREDARFVKDGVSPLDALAMFYVEGGGFRHTLDGIRDGMATEQAYYALTAYFRMLDEKNSLYDMTDVVDMGGDLTETETDETVEVIESADVEVVEEETELAANSMSWLTWLIGIVAAVIVVAMAVLAVYMKKRSGQKR